MIVASNLEEAISLSYQNINKEIHYPGGAISYVDKLPIKRMRASARFGAKRHEL